MCRCQRRGCQTPTVWVGGWRKTAPARAGDRGAHHKGACLPTSVVENRAPLVLMTPALPPARDEVSCRGQRRSLSYNAEEPRLRASVVPSSQWKRHTLSYNAPREVFKHP
ncbi:MAG: hypothetical protein LBK25_08780 [Treponema sp.]|nr:hypothetical protein [Treponema sp.]